MFSVSRILILILLLVMIFIVAYKMVYTYKINKRIHMGEIVGKPYVDMSRMIIFAVITGLVIYSGLLTYIVSDSGNQEQHVSRNNYAIIDVSNPEEYKYTGYFGNVELEDASFAKVYSKEENPGYNKEVIASGEYLFTVFTRNAPADSFHPDFLCFVEFKGDENTELSCYSNVGFQAFEEDDYFSVGTAGDVSECLLYIGNVDVDYSFQISMALIDKEAEQLYLEAEKIAEKENQKEPKVEDFADSVGGVTIIVEEI